MIDFRDINTFGSGPERSFEDLLRVLVKKVPPEDNEEYQANDGRGGDGGVEALWLTSDGKKVGYQAKYFWSFKDTQLKQMDRSVQQAIATHSEIKKYVIAIPFDPTADRGPKVRGKSEWEKWADRVAKWKEQAANQGVELEFELWTKTVITEMLSRKENSGLRQLWFDDDVLDDAWFSSQVDSAAQRLDDRFNPEDHVDVDIEALFDTIVRGPAIIKKIDSAFRNLRESPIPNIEFLELKYAPKEDILKNTKTTWSALLQLEKSFSRDPSLPWCVEKTVEKLSVLQDAVGKLVQEYISVKRDTLEKVDQPKLDDMLAGLRKLSSACNDLQGVLGNRYIAAEEKQCSIVYGPAGVGKSHLLARVAEERVKVGHPTILLLGQDCSSSIFWRQTGKLLELKGRTSEDILKLLNAAGIRKNQRVLLLFDAINEGAGSGYWYSEISSLITKLKSYSHIAAIFSCREEYLSYAVPENLLDSLPKYRMSGFSSQEELEKAAINYLDKKRIARPNTPWLAPEFSNPLFLKITSEALEKKGETEFPKGLRGISEIIALYLDALSCLLKTSPVNPVSISDEIKRVVQEVAKKMAEMKQDFLDEVDAKDLITDCFSGRTPPGSKTWLQILSEASLFRIDPPPFPDNFDPLNPPPDRVRFTFQRFQDHLMAIVLTKQVQKGRETEAFAPKGPLSFLLTEYKSGAGFDYRFTGLVGALSTTFPEELDVEFAKTLPDWEQNWENETVARSGFAESIRWRKTDAFSEETLDLLNRFDGSRFNTIALLLEVSMATEHPYNALLLHRNLKKWSLPERDREWTWWVNQEGLDEHSQIERIISWALSLLDRPADIEHLELASIVLTWCLSSSYITLRDRATKALATIFLTEPSVFEFVARKIHDCDDPYVIERLYAAAFGACCLCPIPDRLSSYSTLIYELVFASGKPPVGLLSRDYALGVIELAHAKGALSSKVCIEKCYHPFSSDPPTFGLKSDDVEKIAESAGGERIFRSASSEMGDYGKYSIPGRVQGFLNASVRERKPNINSGRVSVEQCRLWVTRRAYELGWTAELFPDDHTGAGYVPRHSDLERIGKKYQRIALDELQARLADNFWVIQDWSDEPTKYRYSHHDFRRDIEPTILPTKSKYGESCCDKLRLITQHDVSLPDVDEEDLKKWPFQEDPTASFIGKICRAEQAEENWLVLYELSLDKREHNGSNSAENGARYEEFRFTYCVLTRKGKAAELAEYLNQERSLDVSSFQPREFADGPYLLEAHWRDTWQSEKPVKHIRGAPKGLEFLIPIVDYHWESHLDKTLPEGFSRHLPEKWFASELGLKMANSNANSWVDSNDKTVLISVSKSEGRSTVLVDETTFLGHADRSNLEPVWIMIAERNAWPNGTYGESSWRRSEAVAWKDGGKWKHHGWNNDTDY